MIHLDSIARSVWCSGGVICTQHPYTDLGPWVILAATATKWSIPGEERHISQASIWTDSALNRRDVGLFFFFGFCFSSGTSTCCHRFICITRSDYAYANRFRKAFRREGGG